MRPIHSFTIRPALPSKLERLRELAGNLWWSWNMDAINLFRRLDPQLWETTGHNPILMLGMIDQQRLEKAERDEAFLSHMERVLSACDRYMQNRSNWYDSHHETWQGLVIAYFSAEFGLADCIPNYSGGLGILSGDHLKSASDLGLPLIGVGMLYQKGYFRQYLSADGWQQERYPENDFYTLPLHLERRPDGSPVTVQVTCAGRTVHAQLWWAQVGRVPLLLLDTNTELNNPYDRDITDQLYGGDIETRIRQEIVLGIGGIRALKQMGFQPTVCHMNEGHSAFLALERILLLMEEHQLPFATAREIAAASNVFTTHTPVPAGIDIFPPYLMDKYFGDYYPRLGLSRDEFLALGRANPDDPNEYFSMAILALRLSAHANGVSRLHAAVARQMWQSVWPNVPQDEIPIHGVTNGIHLSSWISHDMAELFDRYLGPTWRDQPTDPEVWQRVDEIPDAELWRTHERRRERLIAFARRRLRAQYESQGAPLSEIEETKGALDPEALTIGFGRRVPTYKRATLILRDLERLSAILNQEKRPVQIIYAGKAHPADHPGKELIKQIVHLARREEFRRRIVFLEDYDMTVARYMLQGVDLWLNTPRRFREASGTSGMKATANGAINISVLDGWWDEAYRPEIGWAIGRGEVYDDLNYQDEIESNAIYDLLEKEIVPSFYNRGPDGAPRAWIAKMKTAMQAVCPYYNTNRMVIEYTEKFYIPSAAHYLQLTADGVARASALAAWRTHIRQHWSEIRLLDVRSEDGEPLKVGDKVKVWVRVHLGELKPQDVTVELYHGPLNSRDEIAPGTPTVMTCVEAAGNGDYIFLGDIPCGVSGRYGYTLRILPHNEDMSNPFEMGLILWAG